MRLVVMSDEQRQAVLKECHNNPGTGNHGGVRATMDRVVAGYYWDTIKADVADWVKEPWEVVGMDLIGPLKKTQKGHQYVLTVTDLFTKWVVAEPLKCGSSTEVAEALVPKLYTFDGGSLEIADPEEELELKLAGVKALNKTVRNNIEKAQAAQKKTFEAKKRKGVRLCTFEAGDEVLISEPKKKLTYVLDRTRPAKETIVLDSQICLQREDFWSLGLDEEMESNVLLVAKKEAIFLDSLCPDGFGDEEYRAIFRFEIHKQKTLARYGQHSQRFAFWTEEAEQLLAGNLPPIYRISQPQTIKEEQVEVEELPSILNDMYQAQYLVTNSPGLFTGQVQEPRYLVMDHQDQMTALRLLKEDTEWDAKKPFTFMFQNAVDLETFMVICRDTLDMRGWQPLNPPPPDPTLVRKDTIERRPRNP
ncbi:hypothetical protein ACEWY4_016081 [Coilia grayii]|uniref:Integrase zinc-binding domain-containing protein n=1 Tax=Coilia grayii TaxID=363190 RepID=A0ABD1JQP4_9TELE